MRTAKHADFAAIEGVLEAEGLPVHGVRDNLENFFVYQGDDGVLVGVVGVELYGAVGLVRSTAVVKSARGRGIAAALVNQVLAHARKLGCTELYLLTLDADRYFERFRFETVSRDEAPEAIRRSPEFTTLCPASAILMRRRVGE